MSLLMKVARKMSFSLFAVLVVSSTYPALATQAQVDADDWMSEMQCESLPLDQTQGYVVGIFRAYASLTRFQAQLYRRDAEQLTLLASLPVEKDPTLGTGSELIRIYTGTNFRLEWHLELGDLRPDAEKASVQYTDSAGDVLNVQMTCPF